MKKLTVLLFLVILSAFSLLAQVGENYHVTVQTLKLRSAPSTSSEIIKKLNLHDNILIINDSTNSDWYQVQFKGIDGYVSNKYISKGKCVVSYYEVRTGAVCRDGSSSSATGRGACSHHGGVAYWTNSKHQSIRIVDK